MSLKDYDSPTRFLHYGMATAVTFQLFISLVMQPAKPGQSLHWQQYCFTAHMWVGICALLIILLHWFWIAYAHHGKNISHLFKWNKTYIQQIFQDVGGFFKWQIPQGGPRGGLPGFIHACGLIVISIMAITGGVMFFYIQTKTVKSNFEIFKTIKWTHEFIATFAWVYWYGHVVMALAHRYHKVLRLRIAQI